MRQPIMIENSITSKQSWQQKRSLWFTWCTKVKERDLKKWDQPNKDPRDTVMRLHTNKDRVPWENLSVGVAWNICSDESWWKKKFIFIICYNDFMLFQGPSDHSFKSIFCWNSALKDHGDSSTSGQQSIQRSHPWDSSFDYQFICI